MKSVRDKLSDDLKGVFDFEIHHGNNINRVDEPAGTNCPLAVVFSKPIYRIKIESALEIPKSIFWHQSEDQHYEVDGMAGYASRDSKQFIYGPMR